MKSLQTLTKKSSGIRKNPSGKPGGDKERIFAMKKNKIILKKFRIDYLENLASVIENTLQSYQETLDKEREYFNTAVDENDEYDIQYHSEQIKNYEARISEGEKLLEELEKMV